MAKKISNKYFIRKSPNEDYTDVTTLFDGVSILSIENFDSKGEAVNVYTAQWVNSQTEDFAITATDENDEPVIIRKNVDIKLIFIVGQRYANSTIDTQVVYDDFVDYMTNTDVWVASKYVGKQVRCVNLQKTEPKSIKLHRGGNSYILGEITLKTLDKPTIFS